jgi:hypothetical protein
MLAIVDPNDPKTEWLRRVLDLDIPSLTPAGVQPVDAEELREKLTEASLAIGNHKDEPEIAALSPRVKAGFAALTAGDLAGASAIATEVAETLAKLISAARGKTAVPTDGASLRQVAAASLNWRKACGLVESELAVLKSTIRAALAADEEFDPEDVEDVASRFVEFDRIARELDTDLSDMAADLAGVGGADRDKAVKELLAEIKAKRAYLETDEWIAAVAEAGVVHIGFVGACHAALDELEAALAH